LTPEQSSAQKAVRKREGSRGGGQILSALVEIFSGKRDIDIFGVNEKPVFYQHQQGTDPSTKRISGGLCPKGAAIKRDRRDGRIILDWEQRVFRQQ